MGGKRKKNDDSDNDEVQKKPDMKKTKRGELLSSMIKNKEKRSQVYAKLKRQKKLDKIDKHNARDASEKRALQLGEEVLNLQFNCFFVCDLILILLFFV
ncbi:hypothetical protein Lalb_Chr04g0254031 [Lupinus albus]|uniref:Uncharacterized protein n=1 Tax=Lupinus albus TaxID=3870 RepID=A0A6A4QL78_LUPAL|nr:hypothetical protein Lalb_Chr04g0254031 [Lupinus albus]